MPKLPIKCSFFVLLVLISAQAWSIDRVLSMGQSFSFPRYIDPHPTSHNRSYHLDTGYFFREHIHIAMSVQLGLDGDQHIALRAGPEFYLTKDKAWLPWIGTKYIYTLLPKNNQGFMAEVGIERDLAFLFGYENLVFRVSTGYAQIFMSDAPNRLYFEMIRAGLMFAF